MDASEIEGDILTFVRPLLQDIGAIDPGVYNVGHRSWYKRWFTNNREGWLSLDVSPNGDLNLMWTSDKDTHDPRLGSALSVTFSPDGLLKLYMESALSMWIKWGAGKGTIADLKKAKAFIVWSHSRLRKSND